MGFMQLKPYSIQRISIPKNGKAFESKKKWKRWNKKKKKKEID